MRKRSTYEPVAVDASAVGRQLEEPPHDPLVPLLLLPRRGRHRSLSERPLHRPPSPESSAAPRRRAPSDFRERRVDAGIGGSRALPGNGCGSFVAGGEQRAAEARRGGMVGESGLATGGVVPVRLRARRWFAFGFFRFELGYRCRCAGRTPGPVL